MDITPECVQDQTNADASLDEERESEEVERSSARFIAFPRQSSDSLVLCLENKEEMDLFLRKKKITSRWKTLAGEDRI